ncbi:MAG: type II secretion system F family protein, partial [Mycobacteriales bacterium]
SSVRVRLDGVDVPAEVTVVGTAQNAAPAAERSVVLLIDTSGSMKGEGIEGAKAAAGGYVTALQKDVKLGLATFADKAQLMVKPTLDRSSVSTALASIEARGETALYDGVRVSLDALGPTGQRRILLLSDGVDTASKATAGPTVDAIRKSGVGIDVVAFQTADSEKLGKQLADITRAGRGRLYPAADRVAVSTAFDDAVLSYDSELQVTLDVPARMAGRDVSVRIDVGVGDELLSDTRVVQMSKIDVVAPKPPTVAAGEVPVADASNASASFARAPDVDTLRNILPGLALLFAGLAILFALAVGTANSRRSDASSVRRVLSLYTLSSRPKMVEREDATALGDTRIARSAVELAGRLVEKRGIGERLALKLDRAGFALRPSEWIVLQALVAMVAFVLLALILPKIVLALLLGLVAGLVLPLLFLSFKAGRRQQAFEESMPDSLQLMAGSLQSGYSLPQALDAVMREGTEPMSGELGRALAESRLGVPIEEALEHLATRVGSKDFGWLVMAIRIQREVGGNLAEVMTTVGETIRARSRLKRQVRALSAEGRLSAYILTGLPVFIGLILMLIRPDYLKPLVTEPVGRGMLLVALSLVTAGGLWMRKLINVEV